MNRLPPDAVAASNRRGIMPYSTDPAKLAFGLTLALWLSGWLLMLFFPQMPDGDQSAQQQFLAWYGAGWQHRIHDAWWWNAAGAWVAWVLFLKLLRGGRRAFLWGVLLAGWGLWAYGQTVGWQGTLFLSPDIPTRLADSQTVITFEQFTLPPAPDGAGRELAMHLSVNGTRYAVSAAHPYRGNGWTVRPLWYGVQVTHPLLPETLYRGESGTTPITLRDGRTVALIVDMATLSVISDPPLPDWQITYYAIVRATTPY